MPTNILERLGTQIVLTDSSFSPGAGEDLTSNNVNISGDMPLHTSIADGSAVESETIDLGSTFATRFRIGAALEFAAAPTAGEAVYMYAGFSANTGTFGGGLDPAGTGNYAGTSASAVSESVRQLELIGIFIVTDDGPTTVQVANNCGEFTAGNRYMKVVLRNEAGQAISESGTSNHIVITPIITQAQ